LLTCAVQFRKPDNGADKSSPSPGSRPLRLLRSRIGREIRAGAEHERWTCGGAPRGQALTLPPPTSLARGPRHSVIARKLAYQEIVPKSVTVQVIN
jgi:hypothetical protein